MENTSQLLKKKLTFTAPISCTYSFTGSSNLVSSLSACRKENEGNHNSQRKAPQLFIYYYILKNERKKKKKPALQ